MKVISSVHGELMYNEEDIIIFKKPIPGFDELNKYILKDIDDESPFKILQSIEDKNIGFIVICPFDVEEEYEIKLNDSIVEKLNIKEPTDVVLYSIVTINSKVEKITANLMAPLVINIKEKKGEQFIVDKGNYKIKHPIMKG